MPVAMSASRTRDTDGGRHARPTHASRLIRLLESTVVDASGGEHSPPRDGGIELWWPGIRLHRYSAPTVFDVANALTPVFCFVIRGHLHATAPIRAFVPGPDWGFAVSPGAHCELMALGGNGFAEHITLSLEIPPEYSRRAAHDLIDGRHRDSPSSHDCERVHVLPFSYGPELRCALVRLVQALGDERDRRVLAPLYLEEIAHLLYRCPPSRQVLNDAVRVGDHEDPVHLAVQYIRKNLTETISVPDLAREVSLSPSAFAHSFRAATGTTPYQYLKRVRLDTARSMLVNEPETSVAEIAHAVGYANPSHFISEFKRRFRVTPGELARS